jgi:putative transposase
MAFRARVSLTRVDAGGVALTGEGGLLPELVKAVLEGGLQAELTEHLGYENGDPAGRGSPNSRNGSSAKTPATEVGDVGLAVPRDWAGSFEPRLVPKGSRRAGGLDEMIISLYAAG